MQVPVCLTNASFMTDTRNETIIRNEKRKEAGRGRVVAYIRARGKKMEMIRNNDSRTEELGQERECFAYIYITLRRMHC